MTLFESPPCRTQGMGLWCVRNSDVLHEEVRDVHHKYHYESVHLARIVEGSDYAPVGN